MKKLAKILLVLLLTLVGVFSLVHVVVANSLSTSGVMLSRLEEEKNALQKTNAMLSERVLLAASYNYIASRAGELGFSKDRHQVYIPNPPLAIKP